MFFNITDIWARWFVLWGGTICHIVANSLLLRIITYLAVSSSMYKAPHILINQNQRNILSVLKSPVLKTGMPLGKIACLLSDYFLFLKFWAVLDLLKSNKQTIQQMINHTKDETIKKTSSNHFISNFANFARYLVQKTLVFAFFGGGIALHEEFNTLHSFECFHLQPKIKSRNFTKKK